MGEEGRGEGRREEKKGRERRQVGKMANKGSKNRYRYIKKIGWRERETLN